MPRSTVWAVAQRAAREQRRGRYLTESTAHPGKMLPELARHAVAAFSPLGGVVVDPMCGIGTSLVEAAHLGRDCFGIEYEPRWAVLAQGNLALARADGAPGSGEVVVGDCRDLASLLPGLPRPDLAALRAGDARPTGQDEKADYRYSTDKANLAYSGKAVLLDATSTMLRAARRILAPDGATAR
jgi:tRNA G37 N-methylase Trm5